MMVTEQKSFSGEKLLLKKFLRKMGQIYRKGGVQDLQNV